MRNNVTFGYPAEFVPFSEEDSILSADGVGWFSALLERIPGLEVDPAVCQEDWGVVLFARRNGKGFWIGLCQWPEGDSMWLAHVHHAPFAFMQRLSRAGKLELHRLIEDVHHVLHEDPDASEVRWFHEKGMGRGDPQGADSPVEP